MSIVYSTSSDITLHYKDLLLCGIVLLYKVRRALSILLKDHDRMVINLDVSSALERLTTESSVHYISKAQS